MSDNTDKIASHIKYSECQVIKWTHETQLVDIKFPPSFIPVNLSCVGSFGPECFQTICKPNENYIKRTYSYKSRNITYYGDH